MIFGKIKDLIMRIKFEGIYYEKEIRGSEHHNPFPDGSLLFDVIILIQLCFLFVGYYHVVGHIIGYCFERYERMMGRPTWRNI